MPEKKNSLRLIGRREFVDFPLLDVFNVEAKIDTGAYTSSIHCSEIYIKTEDSKKTLYFVVFSDNKNHKMQRFEDFSLKAIKNSFGEVEERYIIRTLVKIGRKKIWSTISLSDRASMRYDVLIGRKLLKAKFIIDVNQTHTGGKKISRKVLKQIQIK
ncbi:MAG: ATP-dependent zinc protease [Bacteroidetes bacterium]|nr:ATP-dependent zinc protease [Bacteroidota bacterium]